MKERLITLALWFAIIIAFAVVVVAFLDIVFLNIGHPTLIYQLFTNSI